ncbi:MAG: hypothetical protein ACRENP_18855 [Longimicrobiales bacterium]
MNLVRVLLIAAAAAGGLTAAARAQDARLMRRLEPSAVAAVTVLVDSAQLQGLPAEPLIQKALEGASKQASAEAILAALRALRVRLLEARSALGNASNGELVAGAAALDAGARAGDLKRLRPYANAAHLTNAFLGLTFLLQRGVAPDNATSIVASMLDARLSGSDFTKLQRLVDQDIRAGAPPAEAARVRSKALILHGARSREEGGAP